MLLPIIPVSFIGVQVRVLPFLTTSSPLKKVFPHKGKLHLKAVLFLVLLFGNGTPGLVDA
jgi:hypothetical protein